MTPPVIIDAGPALNFFATHHERLLLSVTGGSIYAPDTVAAEVTAKAGSQKRFAAATTTWPKLVRAKRLHVLPDASTPNLEAAARLVLPVALSQRMQVAKDLGETMVVVHATAMALDGRDVIVLIDDGGGQQLATRAARAIRATTSPTARPGTLGVLDTPRVLIRAAGNTYLPDKAAMRKVYAALRTCDDGLVDIKQTPLLSDAVWN